MPLKLGESVKLLSALAPAMQSAGSVTGTVIDRLGYGDAVVHLKVGAASGSPSAQGVSLKLQTGDATDGSDLVDVEGAVIAALTADNAETELNVDLAGLKRYVAVVVTTSFTGGTTPQIPVAVTIALGNPVTIPV